MDNDDNKIKIFASDDNLKVLGELLSNETSRKIIKNLMEHQMYTNEIATNLDIRINLVIHHLKKLEELGLLEIVNKKIKRKGEKHRFFKINFDIFVTLDKNKEEIEKKGILKRIFRDGMKFTVIGIVALLSLFSFNYKPNNIARGSSSISDFNFFNDKISFELTYVSIIIVITIVLVGLFLVFKYKKKN